ncbi:MAG: RNA processing protein, partial [Cyphobasidiales sp. Tagirdzhanova-0007]
MLPLALLHAAQGKPMLVELKNGETFNGHLVACDNFMNLTLKEAYETSADGEQFWKMEECYIRGNMIKYIRVAEDRQKQRTGSDGKVPPAGEGGGVIEGTGAAEAASLLLIAPHAISRLDEEDAEEAIEADGVEPAVGGGEAEGSERHTGPEHRTSLIKLSLYPTTVPKPLMTAGKQSKKSKEKKYEIIRTAVEIWKKPWYDADVKQGLNSFHSSGDSLLSNAHEAQFSRSKTIAMLRNETIRTQRITVGQSNKEDG